MKPYDNYEIHPCRRFEEPDKPGHFYFEVCEPAEADVWTLYGHCTEGGVEDIGDFARREDAEDTFQRIVGVPFGSYEERAEAVRVRNAAPRLLEALLDLACAALDTTRPFYPQPHHKSLGIAVEEARAAILTAK